MRERREPVRMPLPKNLAPAIRQIIGEAGRHAEEIYGDRSTEGANRILAVWLWHAVRGASPGFLPKAPKRKRRKEIEVVEG